MFINLVSLIEILVCSYVSNFSYDEINNQLGFATRLLKNISISLQRVYSSQNYQ